MLRPQRTFGTKRLAAQESWLRRLEQLLDRETDVEAFATLRKVAVGGSTRALDPATAAGILAIGIDTNALFKLTEAGNVDSVDFLASQHQGPLIIPGQVVQEFWNNKITAIQTQGDRIKKAYKPLADEILKLGMGGYESFDSKFQDLLDEFTKAHWFVFDPATAGRITTTLERLEKRAVVPYVPRTRFAPIAETRDATKTPPGFRDEGHGDFFVWADFLLGLLSASRTSRYDAAVLVTDDVKVDWSLRGQTHPILAAEAAALAGVPFDLWTVQDLRNYVAANT